MSAKLLGNIQDKDKKLSYNARMSTKSTGETAGIFMEQKRNLYCDPKANMINDILTVIYRKFIRRRKKQQQNSQKQYA